MSEQQNLPVSVPEFRSNRRELLSALFSYGLGILYIEGVIKDEPMFLGLFTAAFAAAVLFHFRESVKGKKEHWIWLGCLLLCLGCSLWDGNRVWGEYTFLFLHGYAIYWVLTLSGKLTAGESSAFLPLDALNGAILLPFANFFTFFRTRVLAWGVRRLRERKSADLTRALAILLAVAVAAVLFHTAGTLLAAADENFGELLSGLRLSILPEWDEPIISLILSIPVGAYLFGLIAGADRLPDEQLEKRRGSILQSLARLRHVPNGIWIALTSAFAALYLLFFAVQGSYFFGAFVRKLPEALTVAEYARQGFFELCRVMALNFALLWLVFCSSVRPVRQHRSSRLVCTVLLAESFLFAVTAVSKLLLYIDCFGFTPLRLQSFWLVVVLMAGILLQTVSLWTGKRTARAWIFFTGITLALLHLY